jgi:hypothetical protein
VIAICLCVAGFLAGLLCGRRSLAAGITAVLVVGYFYGIIRANILSPFSHFIFDAALVGFYCSVRWSQVFSLRSLAALRIWVIVLSVWPMLVFFLPTQPYIVQFVGLRGHIFFLPVLLVGALLTFEELLLICRVMAVLNVVVAMVGIAEYIGGVPAFFPPSPVTAIIYASADVAGGLHRIPGTFSSAHALAANMVVSLPFLLGWLYIPNQTKWQRVLAALGVVAGVTCVLMASTRLNFVLCSAALGFAALKAGSGRIRMMVLAVMGIAAFAVVTNPRFQRVQSLGDSEGVVGRIHGSVNRTLLEVMLEYPLGNGLGGAGTSLPHFLAEQVRNPISIENEYARFALEQGLPGMILWVGFILWYLFQRAPFSAGPWKNGRLIAWWLTVWGFCGACIGTGMLTAIPGTFTFLLTIGWLCRPQRASIGAVTVAVCSRNLIHV